MPTFLEFTRDSQQVAAGIVVNDQLSGPVIEQNKAAYMAQFVAKQEFQNIYNSLNNQQYVDKLFENTGIAASAAEKAALVAGLSSGTETRATVLQKVVDGIQVIAESNIVVIASYGQQFANKEFNGGFVAMEYFGYLRRNGDTPGYIHWLNKMNFYGNFIDAEMVRAFLISPEYRSRFGGP